MIRDKLRRFSTHPMTYRVAIWAAVAAVLLLLVFLVATVISMSHDLRRSDQRLDNAQTSRTQIVENLNSQAEALDKANKRLRSVGEPTVQPSVTPPATPASPLQGDRGPIGERGPQGKTGPGGPIGKTGKTGKTGPDGTDGRDGARGPGPTTAQIAAAVDSWCGIDARCQGPQGAAGAPGKDGKDSTVPGPQGPAGPAGKDSTVPGPQGPQGPAGPAGPAGKDSTVPGPKGDTGPTGPAGPAGKDGAAGSPGVSIVKVECPFGNGDNWKITLSDGTVQRITGPCRVTTPAPTDQP